MCDAAHKAPGYSCTSVEDRLNGATSRDPGLRHGYLCHTCNEVILTRFGETKPGPRSHFAHPNVFSRHNGNHTFKLFISPHGKKSRQQFASQTKPLKIVSN